MVEEIGICWVIMAGMGGGISRGIGMEEEMISIGIETIMGGVMTEIISREIRLLYKCLSLLGISFLLETCFTKEISYLLRSCCLKEWESYFRNTLEILDLTLKRRLIAWIRFKDLID